MKNRNNLLWLMAGLFWTLVIVFFAGHEISSDHDAVLEHARIEAKANYNKDLVYRRWAAGHGGVYVPITKNTPPNPYLKQIPERDIKTPSGRKLTLVNPAYMTRQVHELAVGQYGARGHITSLNPIAPYNKPDPWESKALHSFEDGQDIAETIANLDGEDYLRLMFPMQVEAGCLKCHATQGYKVGDLRGGISVSVPLKPFMSLYGTNLKEQVVYHSAIWLLGILGLFFSRAKITKQFNVIDSVLQLALDSEEALRKNESRFKKTQELGKTGGWELDLKQHKLSWSDENCRIFGVPPGTALNYELFLQKVHPDDREYVDREWKMALDGKSYDIEHRLLIDDNVKWVRTKADLYFDQNGNLESALGFTQDITTRKNNEAKIRESEQKFRALYDESPLPYHALDADGYFLEVNPAWLRLLGYEKKEVLGKNYGDFLHPDWQTVFASKFPQFKASGKVDDVYFKIRHKDGHYLDILLGGCISNNPDGSFKNTNCVFTDISSRVQAEQEKEQMEAHAIRASQLATLGELSAGVAHEINNPISGVINYAQIILNKADQGSSEGDLAKRIIKEGERIAVIVSKLLAFSRKEEGEHRVHDIRTLIDVPLSLLGKKLEHDGIKTELDIDENNTQINCNAQQIEQVLLNLITNAQYSLNKKFPQSSGEKTIQLSVKKITHNKKEYMSIAVKDFGIGIPKDVLPHVLNTFYTTKEAGIGTGLGLSISENIIKLHGGTIRIDSVEGEYTNVIIELPM